MMSKMVFILQVVVIIMGIVLLGCENSNETENADGDTEKEAENEIEGEQESSSDGDIDSEDDATETEKEVQKLPAGSIIEFAYHVACQGCEIAAPCNLPGGNNAKGLTFVPVPSESEKNLLAIERYEAFANSLPVDTCKVLTKDDHEKLKEPVGTTILDAGKMTLNGDWKEWSSTVEADYDSSLKSYNAVIMKFKNYGYDPTGEVTLDIKGGGDLASLTKKAKPVIPVIIESPKVDSEGKYPSIPKDKPLALKWSGASDVNTINVFIEASWCSSVVTDILMCHLDNDGNHTISAEQIGEIKWANMARLWFSATNRIPLELPKEIYNNGWALRADVSLYIHDDPDAKPSIPQNCGPMETGEVGKKCTDDSQCGSGCCLKEVNGVLKDNYCSIPSCSKDSDCPSDAKCFTNHHLALPYDTYCAVKCTDDNDCRTPDYMCDHNKGSICIPNFW